MRDDTDPPRGEHAGTQGDTTWHSGVREAAARQRSGAARLLQRRGPTPPQAPTGVLALGARPQTLRDFRSHAAPTRAPGWLTLGEPIEPWPLNEPKLFRSGMPQPCNPARAPSALKQVKKTADPARRPRLLQGPIAAREWDVAHAAALRALLTQPPAVLPNQVGDPLELGRPPGTAPAWSRAGGVSAGGSGLYAQHGVLHGLCPEGCDAP